MKVSAIQRDISLKHGGSGFRSKGAGVYKSGVSMCENNTGINTGYCGSFTGKSEAAANILNTAADQVSKKSDTLLDKILRSNWYNRFTAYAFKHNIASSALIALVLAGVMRPAAIMTLPGDKDKDDKIYASGHAMASGIMGFAVSTIITSPFDESIRKVFDISDVEALEKLEKAHKEPKNYVSQKLLDISKQIKELTDKAVKTKEEEKLIKSLTSKKEAIFLLAKNIPEWLIAVPRSVLTIALIPPILKYVFGVEKKQHKDAAPQDASVTENNNTSNFIEKPVFAAFKGGVK